MSVGAADEETGRKRAGAEQEPEELATDTEEGRAAAAPEDLVRETREGDDRS